MTVAQIETLGGTLRLTKLRPSLAASVGRLSGSLPSVGCKASSWASNAGSRLKAFELSGARCWRERKSTSLRSEPKQVREYREQQANPVLFQSTVDDE